MFPGSRLKKLGPDGTCETTHDIIITFPFFRVEGKIHTEGSTGEERKNGERRKTKTKIETLGKFAANFESDFAKDGYTGFTTMIEPGAEKCFIEGSRSLKDLYRAGKPF